MDPKRRSPRESGETSGKRTGPGVLRISWTSVMISTKSQPWLCPPKLTPILGSWIRSLLSSKCSSAHIHLCLDLRSLHAVVLPSPASRQQGHHRHCQSPSSAAVPTRAQTTRARAQFAPRLTHNERTLASRFRGRAICFLLKPQPRNCSQITQGYGQC